MLPLGIQSLQWPSGSHQQDNQEDHEGKTGRFERARAEELPHVLWEYRTTIQNSTGETPFSLTYGAEVVVPVEMGLPTLMVEGFDPARNEETLRIALDQLEEHRETARLRVAEQKNRIARYTTQR